MIKKLLGGLAVVGLCAGAALYLSSCAQQAGPLSPDLGLLNASSTTAEKGMPRATINAPGSVSQTATVDFTFPIAAPNAAPMNPATINTSNIQVYQQSTDGLSESLLPGYTVAYDAAACRAVITPSGGVWGTDARYHIVVGIGCQSVTGNQLDGNGNGIPEDPTFDNKHGVFIFGTPPANFTYPGCVQVFNVDVNGTGILAGGYLGGIDAVAVPVTITIIFALSAPGTSDPNFDFDSGSYFLDATTLHPNVRITDINGTMLTPTSVVVSGVDNEILTITLTLQPSSKYFITLKGGLDGIRTPLALASQAVVRGLRLDGDGDGVAEASDDWKTATIMTSDADNNPVQGFTVNAANTDYEVALRRIKVVFDIPAMIGSGTLNPSTVNSSTFILIDEEDLDAAGNEPPKPIIPTSIQLNNTIPSAPEVYLYIPEKFSSDTGDNHDHTVRLIVTPGVLTAEGLAMDNNGDGVLGMPNDTYDDTFTVENHQQ